jgi:hypothetical protein
MTLADRTKMVSPSRRYVAVCVRPKFDGYYFRSFKLPEEKTLVLDQTRSGNPEFIKNNAEYASWYFLNELNLSACLETCMPWEQYKDLAPQTSYKDLFNLKKPKGLHWITTMWKKLIGLR